MADILAFDSVKECPKCGQSFNAELFRWGTRYRKRHDSSGRNIEHLARECSVCNFAWREYCKDHRASPKTEPNDDS